MNLYYLRLALQLAAKPKKIPAIYRLAQLGRRIRKRRFFESGGEIRMPGVIAIMPTYRCNLNCIQCGQRGELGFLSPAGERCYPASAELSTEKFVSVIDEIAEFKPYLYFTGGEPLLSNSTLIMIRHAAARHLLTSLNSNCTLLAEKADELIRAGLDYLYASLDGPPVRNDQLRQGTDSSLRAVQGIQALVSARRKLKSSRPLVEVRMTVTFENQGDIVDTARYVDQHLQADVFGIALQTFTTDALLTASRGRFSSQLGVEPVCWRGFAREELQNKSYHLLEEQLRKLLHTKWRFKLRLYPPLGRAGFECADYFGHPEDPLIPSQTCGALYLYSAILPNGDVATCSMAPDYIAGNIQEESFRAIWRGERYRRIRESTLHNLFPVCNRCLNRFAFS